MVKVKIDGRDVSVSEGTTILEAARTAGVAIPTLCHLKGLNEVGACRICVVEVKGAERLVAACNTAVTDGMDVVTASERVRTARRNNLQLILSEHDCNCLTCVRNGRCRLQTLAREMGVLERQPYRTKLAKGKWDGTLPFVRTDSRCISCLRCVNVCDKMQGMKVWDLLDLGRRAKVRVREGKALAETNCTYCGQCVTHCPVGALNERDDTRKLMAAVYDPKKTVVLQVAPAVRAAWGEDLGLDPERATERRMVAAFRRLGVDCVFDTDFAADLTIMEEGSEFLERLKTGKGLPLLTSCCPGWVRFLKSEYPEFVPNLSSAKSPQQMFGAVTKTYFAEKAGRNPSDIVCVSVMPCTAKKWEAETVGDVDLVLTTREIDRLLLAQGVDVAALPEEDFDSPLGTGSGAGVIFGATGGVMEAALRSAYFLVEGKNPPADAFRAARGTDGRKELAVTLGGREIRACVASGLVRARQVMEDVKSGRATYDFVEVMACPGGCAGGGGQPIADGCELAGARGKILYELDAAKKIRFSHENPSVQTLYREFLGNPLSEKSHALLHTKKGEG